jgi:hypothetical protein
LKACNLSTASTVGIIKAKQQTARSCRVPIDVVVRNQDQDKVAPGEAMVEFPTG